MKSLPLVFCIGVLSLCRLTLAQNPGQEAISAKSDAQFSFGALKSLAGTWTGSVKTDPPNPEIRRAHPSHDAPGFSRKRPGA